MPSFRSGPVVEILAARAGLQKVRVDLGDAEPERAYVLTQLVGDVAVGDDVVVNTTAVELGLGTGGWHFVHWNLSRRELRVAGPGHIMKVRYTSLQVDAGSTEEHHTELRAVTSIDGLAVVAASLHSQVAGAAVAIRDAHPDARIAYVMTDSAALPLALSDLVADLRAAGCLDTTITCGQAFGGDLEAVTLASALAVARTIAAADVAIVAMGPGIVGTGTALGHGGVELAATLDLAAALGGRAIAAVRASDADPRDRHRGVSHHTILALARIAAPGSVVALPARHAARLRSELDEGGVSARHQVVEIDAGDVVAAFARRDLEVASMGRAARDDPILHECAAAAGLAAFTAPTGAS